eukprot:s4301_g10.t3
MRTARLRKQSRNLNNRRGIHPFYSTCKPWCTAGLRLRLSMPLPDWSSQDARAQNWPGVKQGVRFATMADEPEDDETSRNRLFEIVRDGDYVDAKKALATADMAWRHSALQQNFLFFIAARRRRGSESLARQCIVMGLNLEELDKHGQTPLFWAAARGNIVMVKFLMNLGFEVNFRDFARKSALFFAIENGHLDVADYMIERAASILIQSSDKKTPQSMLKALNHKAPSRKRPHVSPTPNFACPGAATRSHFAQWEWAGAQEETDPIIEKKEDNVLVENQQYYVCASVTGCAKRDVVQ